MFSIEAETGPRILLVKLNSFNRRTSDPNNLPLMPIDRPFELSTSFIPAGDQPEAIKQLSRGLKSGDQHQTLLGVTGSGKTFTVANVISQSQRPVLVITHNKTLAAQLYSEFKNFFKENAVEFFISYYDYYLPEAYLPQTDTYIAKDSSINEEIEKLRLAATSSLMERRDVIIVASVSCIYGLGSPDDFSRMSVHIEKGFEYDREEILAGFVNLLYERNDHDFRRGKFRVSGEVIDIFPAYRDDFIRIELWGDEVESITSRNLVTCNIIDTLNSVRIFPAKHFMMPEDRFRKAKPAILAEMKEQVKAFEGDNRLVEAQRIFQRTTYDLEMMAELGYCSGIENYSRHLSGREPGSRPYTLIDYFPDDFVTVIDESHVTIPQLRGMYNADRTRKMTLVEHGFRLPSALDNRPLNFDEFFTVSGQRIYTTATPGAYEIEHSIPVQQVVRPTGLLDPKITIRPLDGQVDDLIAEIRTAAERGERVLVTTLTKKMAEGLADYLQELEIRVKYIHSEIGAIERVDILRDLRTGKFDCLVGINLLREGLDLPEVGLVAILDADKEGFLRSETSLIQTAGRASRNVRGRVIFYADRMTDSIKKVVSVTEARRERQRKYNEKNGIVPTTAVRAEQESLRLFAKPEENETSILCEENEDYDPADLIEVLEAEMLEAAGKLEFERAAQLRDQIKTMQNKSAATDKIKPEVKY